MGFYLFSKEVLISHAYIHMVEAGTTVNICGMTVRPGDLIHADSHGAIVIPGEIAGQLAEACVRAMDAEEALKGPCQEAIARGEKVTAKQIMAGGPRCSAAGRPSRPASDQERIKGGLFS